MTEPTWDYNAKPHLRDLVRNLPVVCEAVELLRFVLLYAEQEFLQPPSGMRPGVWDDYLARMRAVVKELK